MIMRKNWRMVVSLVKKVYVGASRNLSCPKL
jgi:hypothetical protein